MASVRERVHPIQNDENSLCDRRYRLHTPVASLNEASHSKFKWWKSCPFDLLGLPALGMTDRLSPNQHIRFRRLEHETPLSIFRQGAPRGEYRSGAFRAGAAGVGNESRDSFRANSAFKLLDNQHEFTGISPAFSQFQRVPLVASGRGDFKQKTPFSAKKWQCLKIRTQMYQKSNALGGAISSIAILRAATALLRSALAAFNRIHLRSMK